jgi:hypothetical protein
MTLSTTTLCITKHAYNQNWDTLYNYTQHYDVQYKDTQNYDAQYKNTQYNKNSQYPNMQQNAMNITTFSVMTVAYKKRWYII